MVLVRVKSYVSFFIPFLMQCWACERSWTTKPQVPGPRAARHTQHARCHVAPEFRRRFWRGQQQQWWWDQTSSGHLPTLQLQLRQLGAGQGLQELLHHHRRLRCSRLRPELHYAASQWRAQVCWCAAAAERCFQLQRYIIKGMQMCLLIIKWVMVAVMFQKVCSESPAAFPLVHLTASNFRDPQKRACSVLGLSSQGKDQGGINTLQSDLTNLHFTVWRLCTRCFFPRHFHSVHSPRFVHLSDCGLDCRVSEPGLSPLSVVLALTTVKWEAFHLYLPDLSIGVR